MPMTAAQIVAQACLKAGVPGFGVVATGATTSPAGLSLNQTLQDIAQVNDLDVTRGTFAFNFNPSLNFASNANLIAGSGPYSLPADFLRCERGDVMWFLNGVPYLLTPIDLVEFDLQVQQAGIASYPYLFVTDISQSPPVAFVYPPPSGAYPVQGRYRRQMPDIANPETSAVVPWFPNQRYLVLRVAADLADITGDERAAEWNAQAAKIMSDYLQLADDRSDRAQRVQLDPRKFGRNFQNLRTTKRVGWG